MWLRKKKCFCFLSSSSPTLQGLVPRRCVAEASSPWVSFHGRGSHWGFKVLAKAVGLLGNSGSVEYFALAIFTVPLLSISSVVVQDESVQAHIFWFHYFFSLWLFSFLVHFSVWLVKLLLFLYQDRLHTLLIKLPGFLFQWHPSFECVSGLLNQLCIETLEGSTTLLFELHIWFNPRAFFCLFSWLLF